MCKLEENPLPFYQRDVDMSGLWHLQEALEAMFCDAKAQLSSAVGQWGWVQLAASCRGGDQSAFSAACPRSTGVGRQWEGLSTRRGPILRGASCAHAARLGHKRGDDVP